MNWKRILKYASILIVVTFVGFLVGAALGAYLESPFPLLITPVVAVSVYIKLCSVQRQRMLLHCFLVSITSQLILFPPLIFLADMPFDVGLGIGVLWLGSAAVGAALSIGLRHIRSAPQIFRLNMDAGVVRRTRFMTWFFLVFSLAFFLVRDFRVALEMPLLNRAWGQYLSPSASLLGYSSVLGAGPRFRWLERRFSLERYVSPEELLRLADAGDARLKAFAALHLPAEEMQEDIFRLADEAVAAEPELTWIFSGLGVNRFLGRLLSPAIVEQVENRLEQLEAFDPDNALPHLLQAELIRAAGGVAWPSQGGREPEYLDWLAEQVGWRRAMRAAFVSSSYDTYSDRRFDLERQIFLARGWDDPAVVWFTKVTEVPPFRLWYREYGKLLVFKLGAEAEAAGRLEEALEYYWEAWSFGQRMWLAVDFGDLVSWAVGMALQDFAKEPLVSALNKAGREPEAALVESAWNQSQAELDRYREEGLPGSSRQYNWSVLLVNFSAGLVMVFFLLTVFCVVYVNAKRWIRPERRGLLYQTVTVAENYASILLFVSCLALYVTFFPYGQDFAHYMSGEEFRSLPEDALPVWHPSLFTEAPQLGNPFREYALYALGGLVLLTLAALLGHWRTVRTRRG